MMCNENIYAAAVRKKKKKKPYQPCCHITYVFIVTQDLSINIYSSHFHLSQQPFSQF